MATKLYLHAASSTVSGTLPTSEQSSLTAADNFEANQATNRLMDTTIGTSQTSLANSSLADTNTNNYYVARWVSPQLNQTSVSANTWTYNFAAQQSNAAANFPCSGSSQPVRVNCYVWKPSNGTKYGTILDGDTASTISEPSGGSATAEVAQQATFSGSAVSSLTANDAVIVFEAWFIVTQANTTSRTQTFYFDGTTENTSGTVSNHASFISTPENLIFGLDRVSLSRIYKYNINSRISLSRIYKYNLLQRARSPSLIFDGNGDYVECGNHSDLWSQGLTKFSFTFWVYPTTDWDGTARFIVLHGSGAQRFQAHFHQTTAGRIIFRITDSGAVSKDAVSDSVTANAWNHISCVYDNSLGSANLKVYVNKVVGATTANLTETINQSATLRLGSSSTDGVIGNVKDFRFYKNIALTQTNIDNIYDNNDSAPTPDYWLKMLEGTSTPVDFILAKTTTLNGSTAWSTLSPNQWSGNPKLYKYNIIGRISLSQIYKYDLIGRISLSRIYKYHIANYVSLSSILKYNINSRVSLSRSYLYNILARISLSRNYLYNIIGRVSLSRNYLWDILEGLERISLSQIYKWDLQSRVSLSRNYLYNIIERISLDRIYKWNIQERVALSQVLKYNINERVSRSRTYLYDILGRVSLSRNYLYDILGRVSFPSILKYDIIGRVSLSRTYLWDVVEAGLTRIEKSQIYKYDIVGRLSLARVYKYNILQRISLSRIYKYYILNRISLSQSYLWNVLGRVTLSNILKYDILSRISLSKIYKWNIIGRVSLEKIYKWNVLQPVIRISKSQIYKWNILARVSLSRIYRWYIPGHLRKRIKKVEGKSIRILDVVRKYGIVAPKRIIRGRKVEGKS